MSGRRKSKVKKSPEEKWRSKYHLQFENGTLKVQQYDLLSGKNQIEYLDKEIRKKYGPDGQRPIGGKYTCNHCARVDLFELNGYITDEEQEDE
jgi:hypothetical protein